MKKKTSLVLGFMIIILLAVSSGLTAQTTYTVGTGGGYDYTTITDAITAASDGDIIDVYGTITEAGITVDKGLTIQGQGEGSTIVQAHADVGSASDRVFEITSTEAVLIKDMTIRNGNSLDHGGGVYLNSVSTLNNCTLSGNIGRYGGSVYFDSGGSMNNCTLSDNHGRYGGGAYFDYGGTMNDCTLSGNSSEYDGGGAYLYYGGSMDNCTLSDNSATDYSGGGASLDNGGILTNCILWSNTSEDGNDIYVSLDGTVLYTCASDGLVNGVDGCIVDDPLFEDPASNDYHLQPFSPCIDTGNNAYVVGSYDLDGNDRIQNGTVDMGVYEGSVSGITSPENVIITFESGTVSIVWDEVSGAASYIIYSSDEPYDNFMEDTSGTFTGASWSATIGDVKKFYYVTAVE